MRPLLFADWRAINRHFCALVWLLALGLTLVILGHLVDAPSVCASGGQDRHGSPCGPIANVPHPIPR